MSYVELSHKPIWHAQKIAVSKSTELDVKAALQIAAKSFNVLLDMDGLDPTIFVYDKIPRLGFLNDPPPLSTCQNEKSLRSTTEAMSKNLGKS